MKRRNILHTGMAAMLLLSVSACEDFKFGNDFLDKPITTVPCPTFSPQAEDYLGRH